MVAISQELFKIASPNVDFKKEWKDEVHGKAWTELLECIARGVSRVIPDACQKSVETGAKFPVYDIYRGGCCPLIIRQDG
eukprot:SAG11_NODE_6210_length_1363_cov_4.911392_2_plen_80_part_00